jgi:hypothetical protein
MADPELVRVLDYILNRCDEKNIEAVAAAVVRRRRDLTMFGGAKNLPDPEKLARELVPQINTSATINGMKEMVRSMALRIIKQEAPELTEEQAAELTRTWIPGPKSGEEGGRELPGDLLEAMINQFVAFSLGRMGPEEDKNLRAEIGAWPERYWNAFPPVVRLIITDFLNGEFAEGEFRTKLNTALSL